MSEKDLAKLDKAFAGAGTANVPLGAESKFGARYFTSSDGKYTGLDSIQAEVPNVPAKPAEGTST
jgi:hypothetical protein